MFDPTGHELLSEPAAALTQQKLAAQARLAEHLLGVDGVAYESLPEDCLERSVWTHMVVLQINFFLEKNEALVHEGLGDMQRTYNRKELVSPTAVLLRDRFLSDHAGNTETAFSAIEEEE